MTVIVTAETRLSSVAVTALTVLTAAAAALHRRRRHRRGPKVNAKPLTVNLRMSIVIIAQDKTGFHNVTAMATIVMTRQTSARQRTLVVILSRSMGRLAAGKIRLGAAMCTTRLFVFPRQAQHQRVVGP